MLGSVATVHLQRVQMPILLTRHVHGRRSVGLTSPRLRSLAGGADPPRLMRGIGSPLLPNVRALSMPRATDDGHG
jgi:hypothetical protein